MQSANDQEILYIGGGDDERDEELQRALAMSLKDQPTPGATVTFGEINVAGEDDDAELQQALALSLQDNSVQGDRNTHQPEALKSSSAQKPHTSVNVKAVKKVLPKRSFGTRQLPPITLNAEALSTCYQNTEPFDVCVLHNIMWDGNLTTDSDKNRWVEQGIGFREGGTKTLGPSSQDGEEFKLSHMAQSHLPWGLVQEHGGPCGVLAAVQAEIIRYSIWGPAPSESFLSEEHMLEALARALGTILARAALTERIEDSETKDSLQKNREEMVKIVLPEGERSGRPLSWDDFAPWPSSGMGANLHASFDEKSPPRFASHTILGSLHSDTEAISKRQKMNEGDRASDITGDITKEKQLSLQERIDRFSQVISAFLLQAHSKGRPPVTCFTRPGGVLLFLMSLVASRGSDHIRNEFDVQFETRLTGQFGHCGQELLNLLLTGKAVSNVFDNTLKPSGDMILRGVSTRPVVGYLSQLEALRYCAVGTYFKSPSVPIWVVGSTSHFSVLFGPRSALNESESDMLLDRCRRAFKSVEGGEEQGFIPATSLSSVLGALEFEMEESKVSALSATLEVAGAGIILWDDFWKAISRLMTGASIESLLQGQELGVAAMPIGETPATTAIDDAQPPPLIYMDGRQEQAASSKAVTPVAAAAATHLEETDEEMARRLASEWGWEDGGNSVDAVRSESPISFATSGMEETIKAGVEEGSKPPYGEDSKPPFKEVKKSTDEPDPHAMDFEKLGTSFPLYHYNGLRGGILTPFRVTRLTPEEAVGTSIALSQTNRSSAHSADLEAVVRTKWPSCAINWLGKTPPFID